MSTEYEIRVVGDFHPGQRVNLTVEDIVLSKYNIAPSGAYIVVDLVEEEDHLVYITEHEDTRHEEPEYIFSKAWLEKYATPVPPAPTVTKVYNVYTNGRVSHHLSQRDADNCVNNTKVQPVKGQLVWYSNGDIEFKHKDISNG